MVDWGKVLPAIEIFKVMTQLLASASETLKARQILRNIAGRADASVPLAFPAFSRLIGAAIRPTDSGGGRDANQQDARAEDSQTDDHDDGRFHHLRPVEIGHVGQARLNQRKGNDHECPTGNFSNPQHDATFWSCDAPQARVG